MTRLLTIITYLIMRYEHVCHGCVQVFSVDCKNINRERYVAFPMHENDIFVLQVKQVIYLTYISPDNLKTYIRYAVVVSGS